MCLDVWVIPHTSPPKSILDIYPTKSSQFLKYELVFKNYKNYKNYKNVDLAGYWHTNLILTVLDLKPSRPSLPDLPTWPTWPNDLTYIVCQPLDSVLARIFCDGGEGGANPNVSAGCLGFPPFPICARSPPGSPNTTWQGLHLLHLIDQKTDTRRILFSPTNPHYRSYCLNLMPGDKNGHVNT